MEKKKVRILSIDGGGIRGIIPATIIKYVENYLREKVPETSVSDHFDLIAGTSTGGILTGIYLAPEDGNRKKAKYSASDALNFYVRDGYNIFNASKVPAWKRLWGLGNATVHSPKNLERILRERFGDLKMSELRKPCLITTYNMNTKSSFFFTRTEDTAKREFLLRDVLRSTSAAPTFFPPAKIKNIAPDGDERLAANMINLDGGVFANNPTMCAYAEARNTDFKARNNKEPSASHMYILSLGAGGGGFSLTNKEKSNKWNLLKWAKSIPEIMIDGSVDTVAFQMKEICKTLQPNDPGDYLRIDIPTEYRHYATDMSDASPKNIADLLEAGEKTLEYAKSNGLNTFLDGLVD